MYVGLVLIKVSITGKPVCIAINYLAAALSSATQPAMLPEFGGKWVTECLNYRFPMLTLLCAGYRVKLI